MQGKQITISDKAKKMLFEAKEYGETYSDTLIRVFTKRKDVIEK